MNGLPLISILTFLPLVGGLIVIGLDCESRRLARWMSLLFSFASLAIALAIWSAFDAHSGALQFEERQPWIPILAVQSHVGIDGLGLLMILLTGIIVPMAMLASWQIAERAPVFFGLVLFLQAGLFGTFTALNFFHWFLFWELSLVPAFFLIKFWGGPQRGTAATRFFVYTMVGSIAMLLAFLAIFFSTHTFEFPELAKLAREGHVISSLAGTLGWRDLTARHLAMVIFFGAFLGFAVKVPLVPFHSWLPPAYSEASPGVTMLLTGLMSKMGVYGFLRILLPIFPLEMRWVMMPLLWLTVISIIFSAAAALAQRDLKRMLAYSSINHLGYCMLGVFAVMSSSTMSLNPAAEKAAALNGVLLQMFNHGLTAATLFWFAGMLEERSGGLRGLDDFGGLRKVAPVFCGLMGISLFSSLGLPGLNGFVGEFLIFKGSFPLVTWATALSAFGLLITAVFILNILRRVFSGPLAPQWATFPDLTVRERLMISPAISLMLLIGIYPQVIIGFINSTVREFIARQF